MDRLLKRGDIFEVKEGFKVCASIPKKFFLFGTDLFSEEKCETTIEVGRKYVISVKEKKEYLLKLEKEMSKLLSNHNINMDSENIKDFMSNIRMNVNMKREEFDTSIYIGKYVVVNVDSYGNKVTAKKLNDMKFNSENLEVAFFHNAPGFSPLVDFDDIFVLGEVTEWSIKVRDFYNM